jgi:hypothetical protein
VAKALVVKDVKGNGNSMAVWEAVWEAAWEDFPVKWVVAWAAGWVVVWEDFPVKWAAVAWAAVESAAKSVDSKEIWEAGWVAAWEEDSGYKRRKQKFELL